jgi:hypothetical protein
MGRCCAASASVRPFQDGPYVAAELFLLADLCGQLQLFLTYSRLTQTDGELAEFPE